MKNHKFLIFIFIPMLFFSACVSKPVINKPTSLQRHYTYTVLSNPREPAQSAQMEIALSLLQMNYNEDIIYFVNTLLYPPSKNYDGIDISDYTAEAYKNRIISEKRDEFRSSLPENDWRYSETINVAARFEKGLIIERQYYSYSGGAHGMQLNRHYIIDTEELAVVNMDDLFENFQREEIRSIVYRTLRANFNLRRNQPLSEGLFFSDEPELSFKFYLTDEGLVIYWDPYEIAPYSSGSIEVLLHWMEIRHFILDSGLELLTKFNIYLFDD